MDEYQIESLAGKQWEETLDFLTADMDPTSIDICVLTDRYREYINEMQEYDLSVPANAIRVLSALLNMKTIALNYGEDEEIEPENPMDFEEPMEELEDEDMVEEDDTPNLKEGPPLDMPVKPRPRRRMHIDELKDALSDAMEVKERREERQEMRKEMDQQLEFDEESLQDKINSLFSRLTSLVSRKEKEGISFYNLMEDNTNEERIEKFMHVLHLENDRKVQCVQEDFLGDLKVKPTGDLDEPAAN